MKIYALLLKEIKIFYKMKNRLNVSKIIFYSISSLHMNQKCLAVIYAENILIKMIMLLIVKFALMIYALTVTRIIKIIILIKTTVIIYIYKYYKIHLEFNVNIV